MKKKEVEKTPDRTRIRAEEKKQKEEKTRRGSKNPDKELIEAELRNEAGDRNRTQTSYKGNIEVTALSDPPVHRETRSMPRTSKAVTDALIKKPSKEKQKKTSAGDKRK